MGNALQLWCVRNQDHWCLGPLVAKPLSDFFYLKDIKSFLAREIGFFTERREEVQSCNYAAFGKFLVGDHELVCQLLNEPQIRDWRLGPATLRPEVFPENFLIAVSDHSSEPEAAQKHKALHDYMFNTIASQAMKCIDQDPDVFKGYLTDMLKNTGSKQPEEPVLFRTVTRYVFHALLGSTVPDPIVEDFYTLFAKSINIYTELGIHLPFGLWRLEATKERMAERQMVVDRVVKFISDSPCLENYQPIHNVSKEAVAELLLAISGIAGAQGTYDLARSLYQSIPEEYVVDVANRRDVMLSVLEAGRLRPPVTQVTFLLPEGTTRTFPGPYGKDVVLGGGTPIAACIAMASYDEKVFPNPAEFNPKRDNLEKAFLSFNHVGFSPTGSGTRQCPGRNIAVNLACDLLIELQKLKQG